MGKKSDGGQAAAMAQAANLARQASAQYEDLEQYLTPEEELQYKDLFAPDLVLSSEAEKIRRSALEDLTLDPTLDRAQEDLLADLSLQAREGLTDEDRARFEQLQQEVAADERARQESIMSQMAQRGNLDSGRQLAAQLSSSQAATQRASNEAMNMAAQTSQAKRDAASRAADVARNMQAARYGQQSDVASARDKIQQFNAAAATRDTAARQQQQKDLANLQLTKEQQRIAAAQQPFQQRMQLAGARAGALSGQSNVAMNQASMAQPKASGFSRALGGAASGAAAGTALGGPGWGTAIGAGVGALGGLIGADGGVKRFEDGGVKDTYELPESIKIAQHQLENRANLIGKMNNAGFAGMPVDVEKDRLQRQADIRDDLLEEKKQKVMESEQIKKQEAALNKDLDDEFGPSKTDKDPKKADKLGGLLKGLSGLAGGLAQQEAPVRRPSITPTRLSLPQIRQIAMPKPQMFNEGGIGEMMDLEELLYELGETERGMNYEADGMGTIIESGDDSYAGDYLEDRINDGEMVLNLDQQDHIEDLLKELAERRRADEMVDNGQASINEDQQDTLMAIARGEAQPEDLDPSSEIVMRDELEALMEDFQGRRFQDGGIEPVDPTQQTRDAIMDLITDDGKKPLILDEPRPLLAERSPASLNPMQESRQPYELPQKPESEERSENLNRAAIATEKVLKNLDTMKAKAVGPMMPDEMAKLPGRATEEIKEKQEETQQEEKPRTRQPATTQPSEAAPKKKEEKKKSAETVGITADELFEQQLREIDDQSTAAAIVDALSTFSNIVNRNQPPGTRIQLPVNALMRLEQRRDNITKAKTDLERQRALEEYRKETLRLQELGIAERTKDRQLAREERREERSLARQQRQKKEDRLFQKDKLNAARGLIKDDPRYKKAIEQSMEFDKVDDLLASAAEGNQASLAALGTKLARAMGEVGVLTDTDVVRYVGDTSWGRKLETWYKKGMQGELGEDTLNDLRKNIKQIKGNLKKDVKKVYSLADSRLKAAYPGMTDEERRGLLGFRQDVTGSKEKKSMSKEKMSQAEKWARENPDDPRSAKILERIGK